MKKEIHPNYNDETEVKCICGNTFNIWSAVKGPIKVEACPQCHPLYTWKVENKVIKGKVEKFLERQKRIDALKSK